MKTVRNNIEPITGRHNGDYALKGKTSRYLKRVSKGSMLRIHPLRFPKGHVRPQRSPAGR